jgi:cathepsin F
MVLWHASRHEGVTPEALTQSRNAETVISNQTTTVERIILVPLPFNTTVHSQRRRLGGMLAPQRSSSSSPPLLQQLRDDFDKWMHHHGKSYSSHDEYQHRFRIWSDNHERTRHKNERHGPCLTQQPVFSPNLFSDLEPNEFQKQYLTGYKGPTTDQLTHERLLQSRHLLQSNNYHSYNCIWYDASCWLRWFVKTYAYGVGGTLEPSSAAYPSSLDWRDHGVVSDVHTQGACGACWAITAVETIESAHALQTGTLIDLAEAEVILCQDSCELCNGGWPQNAYEYVEQQGGLPADTDFGYNADFLLEITYAKTGESDKYDFDTITTQYCPKDNNNNKNRYAKLKGYGYATDRCVCYTDGTGCDCDDQNEALAIRNLASHGPATVCLEASLWQDYAGGIISSESGCSSKFLDMNHCVQVVGYAFDTNDKEDQQSKSHDSRDDTIREGYWIVRNQWSENWGMNGYAYVAMGANTCGVLNDMTQVYMD